MEIGGKTIVLCDCEGSMPLDGKAVARACAASGASASGRHLCRAELDRLLSAAKAGKPLVVGCTQEEPVFAEALASAGVAVSYTNIRERALWSDEAAQALPKVAALLTE